MLHPFKLTISRNTTPHKSQHLSQEYSINYINPGRFHWHTGSVFCLYSKCYLLILYKKIQSSVSQKSERYTVKFQRDTANGSQGNQVIATF